MCLYCITRVQLLQATQLWLRNELRWTDNSHSFCQSQRCQWHQTIGLVCQSLYSWIAQESSSSPSSYIVHSNRATVHANLGPVPFKLYCAPLKPFETNCVKEQSAGRQFGSVQLINVYESMQQIDVNIIPFFCTITTDLVLVAQHRFAKSFPHTLLS